MNEDAKQNENTPAPRRNRFILIGAAVVILAVAGGIGAYFATKGSGTGSSSATTGTGASGGPTTNSTSPNHSRKMLFGYWGQGAVANGVGPLGPRTRPSPSAAEEQKMLRVYCDSRLYDTINLAFLHSFGNGGGQWEIDFGYLGSGNPSGNGFFGRYKVLAGGVISSDTNQTLYAQIGRDITYCQSLGIHVVLAIGGDKSSPYKWSKGDGVLYANLWYNAFLNGTSDPSVPRPFGNAVLNGVQLDIETGGEGWIPEMVSFLTTLKKLSPKSQYSIVPECQSDDVANVDSNTGPVIQNPAVSLDYIIIQYYNNPICAYPFNFNYATWKTYFKGPIAVGLASDETSAISGGFLNPGMLQAVLNMVLPDSQFLGISLYDVSSGSEPFSGYSKIVRDGLDGKVIGSGYGPQGPVTNSSSWRSACGGQWNHVNETCGVFPPCSTDGTCSNPNFTCFKFLANC
ncbi:glycoside hydrolase superfamily [Obelidium mucronatum]|nr:glycoside hydrolase superfamily [Obelidium mucronatum]